MTGRHFWCFDPVMPTPEGRENTAPVDAGKLHDEADFITGFPIVYPLVNIVTNGVCKRPQMTFHLLEEWVIVIKDTETLFPGDKTLTFYPAVNGSVFAGF